MKNNIIRIAHLADIHIRKVPTRNDEYEKVFNNTIKLLKKEKPDRIVVAGDLFHDYLDLQSEQLILASNFLSGLAKIAPVRITRGNHDFRRKNINRIDSVAGLIKIMNNPNIIYYNGVGVYEDDNVIWGVWHHGVKNNNPWKTKKWKTYASENLNGKTTIDLFHDPINGCLAPSGFEMKKKSYYSIKDFTGDYSIFGDIHKKQFFNDKTKGYCGSLIAQDFSEGDEQFHGFLIWNIENGDVEEFEVKNDYSFKNIKLSPYTDFDDLDFEVNKTKYMKFRIIWNTLPATRNKENEKKIKNYINNKYSNVTISNKNEFAEDDTIDMNDNVTIKNITDQSVQHEVFKDYLDKIGVEDNKINDVLLLDDDVTSKLEISDGGGIEWSVLKFGGENFMSYSKIDIDWGNMDGLYQISGENTAGKTTILKLISYVLFGKTLETENRIKYGDKRFVNNKTNIDSCSGYLVLDVNGVYYGIKRKTEISRNKAKEINGASTKVEYFTLSSPNDVMNNENSIESLTEDNKNKTQKIINNVIGTYNDYMRMVMTTSDTLNRILSNDMAIFIDSLLFDSGLDIFDKKLNGLKEYIKEYNKKSKITCNVVSVEEENTNYLNDNVNKQQEVDNISEKLIPELNDKINIGNKYRDDLIMKLHKIDEDIVNLNVDFTNKEIEKHDNVIRELNDRENVIIESSKILVKSYDEIKFNALNEKKDLHKNNESENRLIIKDIEREIGNLEHEIEIINGKIFTLKKTGVSKKVEVAELKKSKVCPTCGQSLTSEHQKHINLNIDKIVVEMYDIGGEIKKQQEIIDNDKKIKIGDKINEIKKVKLTIDNDNLNMLSILDEIGKLTNEKNDVQKYDELQIVLNQIPTLIENEKLKKIILEQKVESHKNSLLQIKENEKINKNITVAKDRILLLENNLKNLNTDVLMLENNIEQQTKRIKENNLLIKEFNAQEYEIEIQNLYKKCVHRDGIPRQLLSNNIIPKINVELDNILSVAPFKVWLDVDDLRPKLAYYDTPNAIIDAIASSGKERTFASIVLKVALNEINIKSKATLFLLDEVTGKLTENSVEEFNEILQIIKTKCKKFLIIEHVHNVKPDYIISVTRTDDGISTITMD